MSLKNAVMKVVARMRKYTDNHTRSPGAPTEIVDSFADQLEAACDAAPDDAPRAAATNPLMSLASVDDATAMGQHRNMIERAKAEFRSKKRHADGEEEVDGRLVKANGGGLDGTFVTIETGMPEGARTMLPPGVYQLLDGELHFDEEQTAKAKASLTNKVIVR